MYRNVRDVFDVMEQACVYGFHGSTIADSNFLNELFEQRYKPNTEI